VLSLVSGVSWSVVLTFLSHDALPLLAQAPRISIRLGRSASSRSRSISRIPVLNRDLVGIDPERELNHARESAIGPLAALPVDVVLSRIASPEMFPEAEMLPHLIWPDRCSLARLMMRRISNKASHQRAQRVSVGAIN
jgi:hypothetical protein